MMNLYPAKLVASAQRPSRSNSTISRTLFCAPGRQISISRIRQLHKTSKLSAPCHSCELLYTIVSSASTVHWPPSSVLAMRDARRLTCEWRDNRGLCLTERNTNMRHTQCAAIIPTVAAHASYKAHRDVLPNDLFFPLGANTCEDPSAKQQGLDHAWIVLCAQPIPRSTSHCQLHIVGIWPAQHAQHIGSGELGGSCGRCRVHRIDEQLPPNTVSLRIRRIQG